MNGLTVKIFQIDCAGTVALRGDGGHRCSVGRDADMLVHPVLCLQGQMQYLSCESFSNRLRGHAYQANKFPHIDLAWYLLLAEQLCRAVFLHAMAAVPGKIPFFFRACGNTARHFLCSGVMWQGLMAATS